MIVRKDTEPGEPFLVRWGPFFGIIILILGSYGSGVYGWATVRSDLYHLRDNIINLQTPLSAVVLELKNKVGEIERRQIEVRERLGVIERSGTIAGNADRSIIKKEIETINSELAGLSTRCIDFNRRIDEIQRKTVENDVMIKNIIDAINPHPAPTRRK